MFLPGHIMPAELDARKRAFITDVATPYQLYDSMFAVVIQQTKGTATSHMAAPPHEADTGQRTHMWISGASCKTVSRLMRSATHAAGNNDTQASATFQATLAIFHEHQPLRAILEIVSGLCHHGHHLLGRA